MRLSGRHSSSGNASPPCSPLKRFFFSCFLVVALQHPDSTAGAACASQAVTAAQATPPFPADP